MTTYTQTSITITDTGKRRVSSSSAEETDKVNNGSAVTLHDVEVTFKIASSTNESPVPSKTISDSGVNAWTWGEVDVNGVVNPIWIIRGILETHDSNDLTLFGQLVDLVRTKGYKTLSGNDMITYYTNAGANAYQLYAAVPTVNVRVKSFDAKQTAKDGNIINFSLELVQDVEA